MTDIMKLADEYASACADVREFLGANAGMDEADGTWIASQQAAVALQSAIEALQEENALLEGTLESRGRNIAALQAENEQFRLLAKANSEALGAALVERDALQAKLNAMGKGEPVIDFTVLHQFASDQAISYNKLCTAVRMCLAAPKALVPRFTECRIELVNAIHTLASHYENRLGRLDPEDRKLADGDIAHAMATAAKWNWNGNGIGGTP